MHLIRCTIDEGVCVQEPERGAAIHNSYSINRIIGQLKASIAQSRVRRKDLVTS